MSRNEQHPTKCHRGFKGHALPGDREPIWYCDWLKGSFFERDVKTYCHSCTVYRPMTEGQRANKTAARAMAASEQDLAGWMVPRLRVRQATDHGRRPC